MTLTPEFCDQLNIPQYHAASSSRAFHSSPRQDTVSPNTPAACPASRQDAAAAISPATPTQQLNNIPLGRSGSQPPKLKWTVASTKALIAVFKDKQFLFDTPLMHERVWEIMCEELAKDMFIFSAAQAKNRFYNLKRVYGKKKDGLKITGSAPIHFDYWDEFEELFSKDHNVTPICTTSNTRVHVISSDRENGEELYSENENIVVYEPESEPPVRSRKRAAELPILQEIQLMREERKDRWEEKKILIEKEREERLEIANKQINDAREGRQIFQSLMEKIIEKI